MSEGGGKEQGRFQRYVGPEESAGPASLSEQQQAASGPWYRRINQIPVTFRASSQRRCGNT